MSAHKWTLTVMDNDSAILSTEELVTRDQAEEIRQMWRRFAETDHGIAIIGQCRTQRVSTVRLDVKDGELVEA